MKRRIRATVVAAVTAAFLGAALPSQATTPPNSPSAREAAGDTVDPPLYDKTANGGKVRVNVLTKERTDLSGAAEAGETLLEFETLPLVTLKVDRTGLDKLAAQANVVSVTEDVAVPPTLDESVPLVGGDEAAAAGKTGAGSAVAVLDTGVATAHPFLKGRVVAEACFSPADADLGATSLCPDGTSRQVGTGSADAAAGPCATIGECDHGTHVAGIAAGDGKGIADAPVSGVAPGADVIAVQVFSKFTSEDYCGVGGGACVLSFTSAQIAGLEQVLKLKQGGTPIIAANMSLGGGRYATACDGDPRKQAIDNLLNHGVATVVAAGNNGHTDAVSAPGCVGSAVTVGSTTDDDELSAFSNRGPLLDVFAPGTGIVSSVPGGGYASKNGTSMAAPHVAGAFAVLRQAFPGKSLAELTSLLKTSGKTIGYTGGSTPRIALGSALGTTPAPAPLGLHPADIDGDGKDDLLVHRDRDVVYHRNLGSRFAAGTVMSSGWSNFVGTPGKGRLYFADITGDGRDDMVVHGTDGTISVRTNTGTYFDGGTPWSKGWSNFLGTPGKGRLYFADITGDGRADMIVHGTDGTISVRTNTGTYFDGGTPWSKGWSNFLGTPGKGRLYFADITGDGRADMIVHGTDGTISVRTNTGTYFDGGTPWSKGWSNFLDDEGLGLLRFGDVTGDRKADLFVHVKQDGTVAVRKNTGSYFDGGTVMLTL